MISLRRLFILPALILLACDAESPSRFHAVVPFSRTKATLGMKAEELRATQPAAVLRAGKGLSEQIGDDEVLYEFPIRPDSTITDDARLNSIAFAQLSSANLMEASAAWAAAVQEMRTALGNPRRCGTTEYSRASVTVALWADGGEELHVTLLSDAASNRLIHSLRQATDTTQLTREIDCP